MSRTVALDRVCRRARRIAEGFCFAALIALAARANAASEAPQPLAFEVESPAPGVYVHYGQQADMTRANKGDIANAGFVVGQNCVGVIDTGGTYAVGMAMLAAIRRVTPLPVCYVINTHVHPDHIFGNQAFVAETPTFVGHARLADAMARRGPNYLHALERDLGDAASGTTLVPPTRTVDGTERLDLGGRALVVRAWKTAHTDDDLTVSDPESGTMFFGDLLFVSHLPVVDGSLKGYLAVLEELKKEPVRLAIPGHGRAGAWPQVALAEEGYLRALRDRVRQALRSKQTLAQAVDSVGQDLRGDWLLFDLFHKRNVSAAYAELEWDE